MRKVRIGINGFGRVGRALLRSSLGDPGVDVAGINETGDLDALAHLLKYDSVHGRLGRPVAREGNDLMVAGDRIRLLSEEDPGRIPWDSLGVDLVVEATGKFTTREAAGRHLVAGAPRVLVTAPMEDADLTVVPGVNEGAYDPARHRIVSAASAATGCAAPVVRVLDQAFGVRRAFLSTTHSLTSDQRLLDLPHRDVRRGRAAGLSIIPTNTGAAAVLGQVLPELAGRVEALALRVPTADVSLIELVAETERPATAEEINAAYRRAAGEGPLKGILDVNAEPLVSVDFVGVSASAVVDLTLTSVLGGTLVRVLAWYDNEWAYACRCRDLAKRL